MYSIELRIEFCVVFTQVDAQMQEELMNLKAMYDKAKKKKEKKKKGKKGKKDKKGKQKKWYQSSELLPH